ncbi:MAG: low specificity L-threonine aldolase [Verrucomicrobiales bacterium]|nr:low specificity L-threonine aldolase [Verrucomicrobiales bacterium]
MEPRHSRRRSGPRQHDSRKAIPGLGAPGLRPAACRRLLGAVPTLPVRRPRHFASDNNSGVCPEAWAALQEVNSGHLAGYGDDPWTARACDLIREFFETPCEVFFVFNGTAANALALATLCRPYHAVLCHEHAHIRHDECGAPAFFGGGTSLHTIAGEHGKLRPREIDAAVRDHFPLHSSKPGALSLTQTTECGTVYRPREIQALSAVAHRHGLRVHLDGARFANAVASLGVAPADLSWRAGVDILSLGLTKNGGLHAEAIVVFDRELARDVDYRIKQAGQLASKMRFLAASWIGLLGTGAWLTHARHANTMARKLATALQPLKGARLLHPTQANGVFIDLPPRVIQGLHRRGWHFYVFEGETGCRLMCSWDTTESDIEALVADARTLS